MWFVYFYCLQADGDDRGGSFQGDGISDQRHQSRWFFNILMWTLGTYRVELLMLIVCSLMYIDVLRLYPEQHKINPSGTYE